MLQSKGRKDSDTTEQQQALKLLSPYHIPGSTATRNTRADKSEWALQRGVGYGQ